LSQYAHHKNNIQHDAMIWWHIFLLFNCFFEVFTCDDKQKQHTPIDEGTNFSSFIICYKLGVTFILSRTLPTPPAAAGDPRPHSWPSSSPETAPCLLELRPDPSPCPIYLIVPCARPISPSSVFGRGGPPCSHGGRPIWLSLVHRSKSLCHPCLC
jgi:hypothetical protein